MEKDCECYEEEVQPYRKTDYKPIIYMQSCKLSRILHENYRKMPCVPGSWKSMISGNRNIYNHVKFHI